MQPGPCRNPRTNNWLHEETWLQTKDSGHANVRSATRRITYCTNGTNGLIIIHSSATLWCSHHKAFYFNQTIVSNWIKLNRIYLFIQYTYYDYDYEFILKSDDDDVIYLSINLFDQIYIYIAYWTKWDIF